MCENRQGALKIVPYNVRLNIASHFNRSLIQNIYVRYCQHLGVPKGLELQKHAFQRLITESQWSTTPMFTEYWCAR